MILFFGTWVILAAEVTPPAAYTFYQCERIGALTAINNEATAYTVRFQCATRGQYIDLVVKPNQFLVVRPTDRRTWIVGPPQLGIQRSGNDSLNVGTVGYPECAISF